MTKIKNLLQKAWNEYNSFKNKYNDKSFDEEFGKVMKEYGEYCMRELINKLESNSILSQDFYHEDDLNDWIKNIIEK